MLLDRPYYHRASCGESNSESFALCSTVDRHQPKIQSSAGKMQHPHDTAHRASSSDTTEAQSTSIIVKHKRFHDHMEQWISSRCDRWSVPIYFEFDAAGALMKGGVGTYCTGHF